MPTETQEFAALRKLTPAEAVSYLVGRGQLTKTYSWQDLWQDEHTRQFTVSRLARADLLQALRDGITKSVSGDLSRRDFMRDVEQLLTDAGWWGRKHLLDPATGDLVTTTFDPARLKLIFDTNTRMAYAAGQWDRIQRTKRTHPYLRYVTQRDERVRPEHRAWDNVTLPVDHDFWATHFPPNGWRCRCRVIAMTRRDYDGGTAPGGQRLKKDPPKVTTREWVNRRTGAVENVPAGVDPGFGYNPGQARTRSLQQSAQDKIAGLSAGVGAALWRDLQPTLGVAQSQAWQAMLAAVTATSRAEGASALVHAVDQQTQAALAQRDVLLESAAILMRDRELLRALDSGAPAQLWRDLPTLLPAADVYLDTEDQALVYAVRVGRSTFTVRVGYQEARPAGVPSGGANFVQDAEPMPRGGLPSPRYERLKRG